MGIGPGLVVIGCGPGLVVIGCPFREFRGKREVFQQKVGVLDV